MNFSGAVYPILQVWKVSVVNFLYNWVFFYFSWEGVDTSAIYGGRLPLFP